MAPPKKNWFPPSPFQTVGSHRLVAQESSDSESLESEESCGNSSMLGRWMSMDPGSNDQIDESCMY